MSSNDDEKLRRRLDALSHSLGAAEEQLKRRGELLGRHQAASDGLRKRADSIREKLQSAIARGAEREVRKYEVERDLADLAADFDRFIREIDVAATSPRGPKSI